MNISELKIIIKEQNKEFENDIYNRYELDVINHKAKLVKVITGPRRAGKSYFLLSLKNKIYKDKVLYINFEDVRLSKFNFEDFNNLIIAGNQINENFNTIFLDEIQNVNGWERFVNTLNKKYNVFITGSNSGLLSKELGTFLTGRHIDFLILPFSFKDLVKIKGKKEFDIYNLKDIAKIKKYFDEYMVEGGYPDIVFNKGLDLNTLIKDIIYKDIVYRYTIKEKSVIESLAVDLLYKYGKYFSYTKEGELFSLAPETIKNYISYLEDAYLLFVLPKFSYSFKSQEQSVKKVYAIDVGFINRVAKTEYDRSKILENIVAIELFRKRKELYYWKDYYDKECDFVITENGKPKELIQVSWELNDNNEKREIDGLIAAMNEFNLNNGLILTYNTEKTITIDKKEIVVKPIWKWLLE